MDYTEQFIRLNCSLMSDYKMMKLNAEIFVNSRRMLKSLKMKILIVQTAYEF